MVNDKIAVNNIQKEQDVTIDVLQRLREQPNSNLFKLQNDVSHLNDKLIPMLDKVE